MTPVERVFSTLIFYLSLTISVCLLTRIATLNDAPEMPTYATIALFLGSVIGVCCSLIAHNRIKG